jgi:hypothetical protein
MIKHIFVGFLDKVSALEGTRWYFRYHSKEVVRYVGPWLRRYETYKAFLPPVEANRYGAVGGFMTELWYANVNEFIEAGADAKVYTSPPGGWEVALGPVTIVPAVPTEDFLGKQPVPVDKEFLRWIRIFRYPKEVPIAEGERWYTEIFSREFKQQPGLLKYVSYKLLDRPPIRTSWQRVEELWFDNFDAWRKAIVEKSADYTPPPWRRQEPFVEMVSIFVKQKPDVDFLKDEPAVP